MNRSPSTSKRHCASRAPSCTLTSTHGEGVLAPFARGVADRMTHTHRCCGWQVDCQHGGGASHDQHDSHGGVAQHVTPGERSPAGVVRRLVTVREGCGHCVNTARFGVHRSRSVCICSLLTWQQAAYRPSSTQGVTPTSRCASCSSHHRTRRASMAPPQARSPLVKSHRRRRRPSAERERCHHRHREACHSERLACRPRAYRR